MQTPEAGDGLRIPSCTHAVPESALINIHDPIPRGMQASNWPAMPRAGRHLLNSGQRLAETRSIEMAAPNNPTAVRIFMLGHPVTQLTSNGWPCHQPRNVRPQMTPVKNVQITTPTRAVLFNRVRDRRSAQLMK
ncbi:hypothetical protein GCM10023213_40040 [Prosthecobacter algae]|uniref:Uncharacterized protein n=1 Tax=Prosthecobacter algae TaxID=1144682 RepID=A0ABP9PHB5_9BACT